MKKELLDIVKFLFEKEKKLKKTFMNKNNIKGDIVYITDFNGDSFYGEIVNQKDGYFLYEKELIYEEEVEEDYINLGKFGITSIQRYIQYKIPLEIQLGKGIIGIYKRSNYTEGGIKFLFNFPLKEINEYSKEELIELLKNLKTL